MHTGLTTTSECVRDMSLVAPFVRFCDGAYVVDESTAEWLAQVPAPIAVVACAGKFRTGKSFLLNKLSGSNAFGVGDSVQPCTRGIWLCRAFLRREASVRERSVGTKADVPPKPADDIERASRGGDDEETHVLLMDTEGIDAIDAECEHDVCIFALAVLMSSVLLYNSNSHLDEAAIQTLSLMTSVADAVAGSRHEHALCWVLRDFALDLVDASGRHITTQEYLDNALDVSTTSKSKCATREAICTVFGTRTLLTLPRPHLGSTQTSASTKTAKAFDRALGLLRTYLCNNAKPFSAHGVPLSGAVYVDFVRSIVAKVNECGAIPKLHDSWTLISKAQHADVERCIRSALLDDDSVQADCVRSTEDGVREWATERVRRCVSEAQFVPPHPDSASIDAIVERLVDDLVRHCVALGKVVDLDEAARSIVDDFFARLVASSHDDHPQSSFSDLLTPLPTAHELLAFYESLPPPPSHPPSHSSSSSSSSRSSPASSLHSNSATIASTTSEDYNGRHELGRRHESVRALALEIFHRRIVVDVVPQFERAISQLTAKLATLQMDLERMRERQDHLNLELLQLRACDDAALDDRVAKFDHAYTQTSCDCCELDECDAESHVHCRDDCRRADEDRQSACGCKASTCTNHIDVECERQRVDEQMQHRIRTLELNLASADARAIASDDRVAAIQSACDAAMDAIRCTTNERIRELTLQRDDAVADARRCTDHRAALESECDKIRVLLREAQQRTVDVHKSTLDELRRRDEHVREAADARRKEWGEVCARAEWAENEVRSLKRRVDELLVVADDAKRLRTSNVDAMLQRARSDVAMEMMRIQLDDVRSQNEVLVRQNTELSNRVAVLEVSSKLEACKQSLL